MFLMVSFRCLLLPNTMKYYVHPCSKSLGLVACGVVRQGDDENPGYLLYAFFLTPSCFI